MYTFHIVYTDKDGNVQQIYRTADSVKDCEKYLESIGATYWEIGIGYKDLPI
jgi:hypothetical protein